MSNPTITDAMVAVAETHLRVHEYEDVAGYEITGIREALQAAFALIPADSPSSLAHMNFISGRERR